MGNRRSDHAAAIDWNDPTSVGAAAGRLGRWLEETVSGATKVDNVRLTLPQGSGGYSNLALLVDATWESDGAREQHELFARVELPGARLVPTADLETEGRLIGALHGTGSFPVPQIVGFEADTSVLGARFLIMQRMRGRVMSDNPPFSTSGWVLDLDSDTRARCYDNGLQALAAVTTMDWRAAGLGFLDRRQGQTTSLERVCFLENLLQTTAAGRQFALHEAALDWVRANRPAYDEPLALSWGDARLGNIMFEPDSPNVAAVLDWEQAVLGSPELDLGWWLYSNRIYSEGLGVQLPQGFSDRQRTIGRFEELTQRPVEHIGFYEAYAGLYIATVMIGIADRLVGAGAVPPEADMQSSNPATVTLAALLDLPTPTGPSTTWATKG